MSKVLNKLELFEIWIKVHAKKLNSAEVSKRKIKNFRIKKKASHAEYKTENCVWENASHTHK